MTTHLLNIRMAHKITADQVTFWHTGEGNNALDQLEGELDRLLNEAYQRGQEDMRQRAANCCGFVYGIGNRLREDIEALPVRDLPEDKP